MPTLLDPPSAVTPAPATPGLPPAPSPALRARIDAACAAACAAIAPAWPLDRAIAVNPHWQRIGLPLRRVAARMAVLAGIQVFAPRPLLKAAWDSGRIAPADLLVARARLPGTAALSVADCVAALAAPPVLPRLPLLIDVLDDQPGRHSRLPWRQAVTHQVSQTCAAWFDNDAADWRPETAARAQGLYAFWRDTLTHDHGIGVLMGLPDLPRRLGALPATRADAEAWALQRLGLPEAVWADHLEAVLLTVQGWASWCAYLGWQAAQDGRSDPSLRDLLAIRLAWGAVLLDEPAAAAPQQARATRGADAARIGRAVDALRTDRAFAALRAAWHHAPALLREAEDRLLVDEVWQLALELGHQRDLAARLAAAVPPTPAPAPAPAPDRPAVQAVFCIDVRSEPMRRALEAAWPGVQTLGFAGFFGLPAAYTPLATAARRPQLPGLLAPAVEVVDRADPGAADTDADANATAEAGRARLRRFAWARPWDAASRWPGAAFSFVETAGLLDLGRLGRWLRPAAADRPHDDQAGLPARWRPLCRPALHGLDLPARVALAAQVLQAMGLAGTAGAALAPLVLLAGHGSQTANNAQAAALDCGACGGQTGEVNARVLARLLNDAPVRQGLAAQGLQVPADTWFVAALHNTTTDEIEGLDLDLLPPAARARWDRLQPVLAQAGDQVRRERAPSLGLDARAGHDRLLQQLRQRANDGAQTRPEWGLAGNAALLIAPRWRSQGVVLDGRVFLHEHDPAQDADGSRLEALMTAPMLVAHWINWQYHASTCDPQRLGSGNKLLHNVVGGRIGVFEGNGGDLRIGLAQQSLHDGRRWLHEPLRLTVVIDAPAAQIERVIVRHAVVRQLVDNGWLHLWRFDGAGLQRRAGGAWLALAGGGGRAVTGGR